MQLLVVWRLFLLNVGVTLLKIGKSADEIALL